MKPFLLALDTPLDCGSQNLREQIYLANEDRFNAVNLSQPLTTYAVNWDVPSLQALLDELFPAVRAARRFEYSEYDNSDAFLSEADDERGLGAEYKVIETGGKSVTIRTKNKGLTVRLDRDLMQPGDEEGAVQRLKTRLVRNELRRGFAAILSAAGTIAEKTWGSSSNPDGDVRALLRDGQDARGMRSDVVVYTGAAFDKRADAYEVQNTPAAGVAASKSPADLKSKFRVDRVLEFDALYTAKSGGAKIQIAGDDYVITYMAPMLQSRSDPSNAKRFYTPFGPGLNGAIPTGSPFFVYREEHTSFVDVTVAHYSNIVVPTVLGVKAIKIK